MHPQSKRLGRLPSQALPLVPSARIYLADSRKMPELRDEEIDLIVTSPPYWHIKDYGISTQIGYGQSLHEYLKDLYMVFKECYRVLRAGGRLCINIGDQFARSIIYGRYKVIPIHSEVIQQCEEIGFDYMGSIVWQKKTTMHTTGGANIMGSFPYPPNGIIEIDYEFILIFRKPGQYKKVSKDIKEKSKLTKEEWKEYFAGHWRFSGTKQIGHEAMFPEELPYRLIRMFSYVGDTVLDPFLGSGTTLKVALDLERNAVGYEINKNFLDLIRARMGLLFNGSVQIVERKEHPLLDSSTYTPKIKDAKPLVEPKKLKFGADRLYKVVEVLDDLTIKLDTGLFVGFLGVVVKQKDAMRDYLVKYLLGKRVILKYDKSDRETLTYHTLMAYVYLQNRIFVNAYLIKSGLADPDFSGNYRYKEKFVKLWKEREYGKRVDS